jgi:thiol-disulfide isomerase/thioredoxin
MRFLIIFIFMLSNSLASEATNIKNLVINKELKSYGDITFLDIKNKELSLNDYKGNLVILNFWATWCAPCKDEMPSLDLLTENPNLDNLKVFPINIGKDTNQKSLDFFKDLEIKNLEIYFDSPNTLAKKFKLRGLPTSIVFNKDGLEFARIIGSIDFTDKKFIEWLNNYN